MKRKKRPGRKIKEFAKQRRVEAIKNLSKKVLEKYKGLIKAIVVVGSTARDEFKGKSDIDLLIIIDDTKRKISSEEREEIDSFIENVADEQEKRLSPQPVWGLTEFWDMMRRVSPLAYNFLRDGIPVYDVGFFGATKRLLGMGRIPATREAAEQRIEESLRRLAAGKREKLSIIAQHLYYAALESVQATCMFLGREPPGPQKAPKAFREYFVQNELATEEDCKILEEVLNYRKRVEHGELSSVKGEDVDRMIESVEGFTKKMQKILSTLEEKDKINKINKNYDAMVRAAVSVLKVMGKLPEDPKQLPSAFKEHLIDSGVFDKVYHSTFEHVLKMRAAVLKNKSDIVPERHVMLAREYVRKFVVETRRILERYKEKSK